MSRDPMKRYDREMAAAWQRCADFNDECPTGTPVVYRPIQGSDDGMKETVTRSEAWTLPSGAPVVMVENKAGGVHLDHIQVMAAAGNR